MQRATRGAALAGRSTGPTERGSSVGGHERHARRCDVPDRLQTGQKPVPSNWLTGGSFAPFGIAGIFAGAGKLFFSYLGFDMVSSLAEEVANPKIVAKTATISMAWPNHPQDLFFIKG